MDERVIAIAVPAGLGLSAVTGQIVLMRETVVLFNGNELSLGIFLAAWLLWTALGSSLGGRLAHTGRHLRSVIALGEVCSGASLTATVWVLRVARAHLQTVPGELLGPVETAFVSLASLSIFCILSGFLFPLSAVLYGEERGLREQVAVRYAYLFETAGSALGGVLASFFLLPLFGSFQIAMVVLLANLGIAWMLITNRQWERGVLSAVSLALAVAAVIWVAPRLETNTQQRLWQGFHLIESRDSIYGRITVLDAGGMYSVYDNGTLLTNLTDPAAAEETVHYALLEHSAPRSLLLVGGGMNGSIAEALKHATVERIDYVELDPALIGMYRRLFPEAAAALSDPRVRVHEMDGRLYLKTTRDHFDVIALAAPEPENAQVNRFYTEEFFRTARDHLAPGGLLAVQLRSSEDAISSERADFLRCIAKTLHRVFPRVAVIPGETMHMFAAGDDGTLTEDPQDLIARLKRRNLQTSYVREYFIPYRMASDRMAQIHELLKPVQGTPVNRDFQPTAYYFGYVLWSSQFKTAYGELLESAARIHFWPLFAGVSALAFVLVVVWMTSARSRGRGAAAWSLCATGYSAMATQILLLLTFQSVCGFVYHELALLIGMFMGGMALGALLGIARTRRIEGGDLTRLAAASQLLVVCSGPFLLCVVDLLSHISSAEAGLVLSQLAFPALAIVCGLPCGAQFSISSAIYQHACSPQSGSGRVYAFDLIGGCGGALVLAAFLIPLFGFWKTAWLNTVISLVAALMLALSGSNGVTLWSPGADSLQIPPQ